MADFSEKDPMLKVAYGDHSMDHTFMVTSKTKVQGALTKGATVKYIEQKRCEQHCP